MTRKWLITGGCGFIGTSLIKSLIRSGHHQIRTVDNLSVGTREDLAAVCRFGEVVTGASRATTATSRTRSWPSHQVAAEVFQIATSRETTVLELLEKLRTISKANGLADPRIAHVAARSRHGHGRRARQDLRLVPERQLKAAQGARRGRSPGA